MNQSCVTTDPATLDTSSMSIRWVSFLSRCDTAEAVVADSLLHPMFSMTRGNMTYLTKISCMSACCPMLTFILAPCTVMISPALIVNSDSIWLGTTRKILRPGKAFKLLSLIFDSSFTSKSSTLSTLDTFEAMD